MGVLVGATRRVLCRRQLAGLAAAAGWSGPMRDPASDGMAWAFGCVQRGWADPVTGARADPGRDSALAPRPGQPGSPSMPSGEAVP